MTRLKERFLAHIPDLSMRDHGQEALMFDADIGDALKKACGHGEGYVTMQHANAANMRTDMLIQQTSLIAHLMWHARRSPQSLLCLVQMILEVPSPTTQSDMQNNTNAAPSISQILLFSFVKSTRKSSSVIRQKVSKRATSSLEYQPEIA